MNFSEGFFLIGISLGSVFGYIVGVVRTEARYKRIEHQRRIAETRVTVQDVIDQID